MGRAVTDPNLLALLEGAPEGGTGISIPPQQGMQVAPQDQVLRDKARLALLEQEKVDNPTDPALAKEVSLERAKQGSAAPARKVVTDPALLAMLNGAEPTPAPKRDSLKDTMGEQANEGWGNALKTGIATSASKTVRALGTTLLPKAAEAWAEKNGYMPSARDMELLSAGTEASPAAKVTEVVGDTVTDMLPTTKVMKGATALKQALPRAAAVGAALSGARAEGTPSEIALEAAKGGAGGLIGEGAGRLLARGLTPTVRPSQEARDLMDRGIYPTLGDAADKSKLFGKALQGVERQIEAMPLTGMPQRMAKERSMKDLFQEAATMANPPGGVMPVGTRAEIVNKLREGTSNSFDTMLGNTTVKAPQIMKKVVDDSIDAAAPGHNVSPSVVDAIKQELNQRLWSGVYGNKMSGQALHNVTEDMFNGLNATRGNTNAQQLVNDIASNFKEHLNNVAQAQGHDLPGLRQSAANLHVLGRIGSGGEGITGEALNTAVRGNNRATGSLSATPEMQKLAEQATLITRPHGAMNTRNPLQYLRDVAGAKSGLGIAAAAYGGINNSNTLKRLILRDPVYRDALKRALSAPAISAGSRMASEEDN